MTNKSKISNIRYILGKMPDRERRRIVQPVADKVDDDELLKPMIDELIKIKNVGQATAKEIIMAVGLKLIED